MSRAWCPVGRDDALQSGGNRPEKLLRSSPSLSFDGFSCILIKTHRRGWHVEAVCLDGSRPGFSGPAEVRELIKQVYRRRSRVVVEKDGIPVIALVSLPDFERWIRLDEEREERFKILDEIHAKNTDKSPEEVESDVADEIAAVRKERGDSSIRLSSA